MIMMIHHLTKPTSIIWITTCPILIRCVLACLLRLSVRSLFFSVVCSCGPCMLVYLPTYVFWVFQVTGGLLRPHNIVAFPLYKGLGYSMTYSKQQSHPKFVGKKGWWSDNLQNRDHTVVAGQAGTHDIAVGSDDLTKGLWVPITDLTAPDITPYGYPALTQTAIQNTLKNIYACEFNRYRIRVDPQTTRISYPDNVYINNVVPIDPSLTKYDTRLTNYPCNLAKGMYTPDNISQYDNIVLTETPRDWLYFAANLRGGARETINVLYSLAPVGLTKREGFAIDVFFLLIFLV